MIKDHGTPLPGHDDAGQAKVTCEKFQAHQAALEAGTIADHNLVRQLRGHERGCDKCRDRLCA